MKLRKGNTSGAVVVGVPDWLMKALKLQLGDHVDFILGDGKATMVVVYREADYKKERRNKNGTFGGRL